MNITSYVTDVTTHFTSIPPTSYPGLLWSSYTQYLWHYEPDSWVATIAYSSRVLAVLLCLPTIILGLLDISSYAIARTLGVVDDVKASTSDKVTATQVQAPTILVEASTDSATDSDRDSLGGSTLLATPSSVESLLGEGPAPQHPKEFFATENNLKLSGVDVLSPAASRASSPVLARKKLAAERDDVDFTLRYRQPPPTTSYDDR
ncbi:hypothetical protein MD484_g2636, partial [Candolleomyces efflorescens]